MPLDQQEKLPACDIHGTIKSIYICLQKDCPNYNDHMFTLFCEDCLDEERHNHMPHFINKIVDREDKSWHDLIADAFKLYEKVTAIEKKLGDLCLFLESDPSAELAKGRFSAGCQ